MIGFKKNINISESEFFFLDIFKLDFWEKNDLIIKLVNRVVEEIILILVIKFNII